MYQALFFRSRAKETKKQKKKKKKKCLSEYTVCLVSASDVMEHFAFPALDESGGGRGGKGRGLGPRNDVLTTCKAVILRCSQRIIALFPNRKHFWTF